jgi:hypothetical protein
VRRIDGLTTMQDYEDILAITNKQKRKPVAKAANSGKPLEPIKSLQLDLFGSFVTNNKKDVSNTIEIWERIPKYFPTRSLEKMQPDNGQPDPYEWEYTDDGDNFTVIIQPALIKEGGVYKAFFPSVTEELIEEALKKILADQNYGIHDPSNYETWVKFSLNMLYRELKDRGCSRSFAEIRRSIDIMSLCNIRFLKNGEQIWNGAFLQEPTYIKRKDYIKNPDALFAARLPVFISYAINQLDYRQFNYHRLMSCASPLSRLIYKRLIHRYTQASLMNDYHFMYSDLKKSGLLQQTREVDNRSKVIDALKELVKRGVLMLYKADDRKMGTKIMDVKYTLSPSADFVKEQKASNRRAYDNKITGAENGLLTVDN